MIGLGAGPNGSTSTVGEVLRAATGSGFPPNLFSAEGLAQMEAITDRLPAALTSTLGFEIDLAEPAAGGDFALAVTGIHGGREILAGSFWPEPLPPASESAWTAVAELSRAWSLPGSILDAELHNVALEFDVREGQDQLPAPNVFLGARTGILPAHPSHPGQIELPVVGPAAWLLDSALPLLGKRLSDARRDALLRCFEALPSGSRAFQVGVMLARPVEALRVCVIGIEYGKVAGFLRRIGWPGDPPDLERRLAPLVGGAESVILDIDVGETVLPTLGLECFAGEDGDPDLGSLWARFLDPLVECELCRPERRQALLDWALVLREPDVVVWPAHLREASDFVGTEVEGSLVRSVNHVKLGWGPEGLRAKGYLRVQHRWRPVHAPASTTVSPR